MRILPRSSCSCFGTCFAGIIGTASSFLSGMMPPSLTWFCRVPVSKCFCSHCNKKNRQRKTHKQPKTRNTSAEKNWHYRTLSNHFFNLFLNLKLDADLLLWWFSAFPRLLCSLVPVRGLWQNLPWRQKDFSGISERSLVDGRPSCTMDPTWWPGKNPPLRQQIWQKQSENNLNRKNNMVQLRSQTGR